MRSLVSKLLILDRKISATEEDGKKLKCKYYTWQYKRALKKLSKLMQEDIERRRNEKEKR